MIKKQTKHTISWLPGQKQISDVRKDIHLINFFSVDTYCLLLLIVSSQRRSLPEVRLYFYLFLEFTAPKPQHLSFPLYYVNQTNLFIQLQQAESSFILKVWRKCKITNFHTVYSYESLNNCVEMLVSPQWYKGRWNKLMVAILISLSESSEFI